MRTLITTTLLAATAAALAEQLQLTPEQLSKTRDIEASMRAKAKTIGAELIDAEARLDIYLHTSGLTIKPCRPRYSASRSCSRNCARLTCMHISSRRRS